MAFQSLAILTLIEASQQVCLSQLLSRPIRNLSTDKLDSAARLRVEAITSTHGLETWLLHILLCQCVFSPYRNKELRLPSLKTILDTHWGLAVKLANTLVPDSLIAIFIPQKYLNRIWICFMKLCTCKINNHMVLDYLHFRKQKRSHTCLIPRVKLECVLAMSCLHLIAQPRIVKFVFVLCGKDYICTSLG